MGGGCGAGESVVVVRGEWSEARPRQMPIAVDLPKIAQLPAPAAQWVLASNPLPTPPSRHSGLIISEEF